MIQALEVHVVCLCMPHLFPLSLRESPFLILLLHTSQKHGDDIERMSIHVVDDIDTALSVDLLADALEDGSALASKSRRHMERLPFSWGHCKHLLSNGLEKLDALEVGFDVEVVVMALLFDTMETLFKLVLSVSNKAGVFTGPSRVRSPVVVQDRIAELIAAAARLKTLLEDMSVS